MQNWKDEETDGEGKPSVEKLKEITIQQTATKKDEFSPIYPGSCARENAADSQHCKYMIEKETEEEESESTAFTPKEDIAINSPSFVIL